jgi:type III secretory pathway component EscS
MIDNSIRRIEIYISLTGMVLGLLFMETAVTDQNLVQFLISGLIVYASLFIFANLYNERIVD